MEGVVAATTREMMSMEMGVVLASTTETTRLDHLNAK